MNISKRMAIGAIAVGLCVGTSLGHFKHNQDRAAIDPNVGNCTLQNKTPQHFQVKILKSKHTSGIYELYPGELVYLSCGDSVLVTGGKYRSHFTVKKPTSIEDAIPSKAKEV